MPRTQQFVCAACGIVRLYKPGEIAKRTNPLCKSCSLYQRFGKAPMQKYGYQKNDRIRRIWQSMRQRCGHFKGASEYALSRYANRGIRVCQEWQDSFSAFKEWALNNGYQDHLFIDRINVSVGYNPDNCRWVTAEVSAQNKSNTTSTETIAHVKALLLQAQMKNVEIARLFNIREALVCDIKKGRHYANIVPLQG